MESREAIVEKSLKSFLQDAQSALGDHLKSAVLYGSAAEGRLRATSDVNLILVLSQFEQTRVDKLRESFRLAEAAIKMQCMFLLDSEIQTAANTFAVKFADVLHRRRVLFGPDPFANLSIPRTAEIARLKQVLLNLALRLRRSYVSRALREEQLVLTIADAAGPLRSSAATLLELECGTRFSPTEALEKLAPPEMLHALSEARETSRLPAGSAARMVFNLIEVVKQMLDRAQKLT